MNTIEKLIFSNDREENENKMIDKINELVERVNQLAKPLLVCKIPGRAAMSKEDSNQTAMLQRTRDALKSVVGEEYHLICLVDSTATKVTFEVHNQQTEIARTLIVQLENFKID